MPTIIQLATSDQMLTVLKKIKLASGDVNSVKIQVNCCNMWDAFPARSAVFRTSKNTTVYEALLVEGECIVPHEVLTEPGTLFIGLRGLTGDGNRIKTSSFAKVVIVEGAATAATSTSEPSPDMYQQYLAALDNKMGPITEAVNARLENQKNEVNALLDAKLQSVDKEIEDLQAADDLKSTALESISTKLSDLDKNIDTILDWRILLFTSVSESVEGVQLYLNDSLLNYREFAIYIYNGSNGSTRIYENNFVYVGDFTDGSVGCEPLGKCVGYSGKTPDDERHGILYVPYIHKYENGSAFMTPIAGNAATDADIRGPQTQIIRGEIAFDALFVDGEFFNGANIIVVAR